MKSPILLCRAVEGCCHPAQELPAGQWRFEGHEGHYPKCGAKNLSNVCITFATFLCRFSYASLTMSQHQFLCRPVFSLVAAYTMEHDVRKPQERPGRMFQSDIYNMDFTPTTTSTTTTIFSMVQILPSVSLLTVGDFRDVLTSQRFSHPVHFKSIV